MYMCINTLKFTAKSQHIRYILPWPALYSVYHYQFVDIDSSRKYYHKCDRGNYDWVIDPWYYVNNWSQISKWKTSRKLHKGPLLLTWFNFNPSMDK